MQKDDVIYRQAAIDELEAKKDKSAKGDIGCFYNTIIQNNIDALKGLPSAHPEIIHCKDCKHWKNKHLCECLSRHGTFETPKDFYCGYGKAK